MKDETKVEVATYALTIGTVAALSLAANKAWSLLSHMTRDALAKRSH